jgi:hypothetical protein
MRTTVVLRDDAYELARSRAFQKRQSLGDAISDLIVEPIQERGKFRICINENGFPVIYSDEPLTIEQAKALAAEDDDEF